MSCKTDKTCIQSSCVCCLVSIIFFLCSAVSMCFYIYYADNKKYEFLGEVSVYTVLLSFLFLVITSNIRDENKGKSSKITPI